MDGACPMGQVLDGGDRRTMVMGMTTMGMEEVPEVILEEVPDMVMEVPEFTADIHIDLHIRVFCP
jgi:hypothetical protein